MAEIQICVDPEEERAFNEYCNFQWPRLGMTCQVPRCSDFSLFTSYNKYVDHFAQKHRNYKLIYECDICHKRIGNKGNKCHHKKTHKGSSVTFSHVKVPNPNFVDPGDVLLPRPPSSTCKNVEQDPEFQQYKRQRLLEKRRDYSAYNASLTSSAELLDTFENRNLKLGVTNKNGRLFAVPENTEVVSRTALA